MSAGSLDVAVAYDAARGNVVAGSNFWLQGGSVQIHGEFWRGLGVVADVAGEATTHGSATPLDLITATFGPRYTWSPTPRMSLFGQALAGEANALNSLFPSAAGEDSSASSMALVVGGGVNLPVARHLAVRALEANWIRTQLPNSTTNVQNNLRVGAGLVFRFR